MNEVVDYVRALDECQPQPTKEDIAYEVAFVYLPPAQLFQLWLRSLLFHYFRR